MLNILYCFDSNYNIQALVSITSLIKNVKSKLNIYIIHDNPESFKKYLNKINQDNIHMEFFKFNDSNYDFPRVKNTHVSIATYYRLFISNYLDSDIGTVLYLDADTVCIQDFSAEIKELQQKIISENILFSVSSDEYFKGTLDRLSMKGGKYFNAGVMLINLDKWEKDKVGEKLINTMKENYENIVWWDQDILNKYIDGEYLELNYDLNYRMDFDKNPSLEKGKILHFLGDLKPWNPETINSDFSNIYQNYFRIATGKKFHIVFNKKSFKNTLKILRSKRKILDFRNFVDFLLPFSTSFLRRTKFETKKFLKKLRAKFSKNN